MEWRDESSLAAKHPALKSSGDSPNGQPARSCYQAGLGSGTASRTVLLGRYYAAIDEYVMQPEELFHQPPFTFRRYGTTPSRLPR